MTISESLFPNYARAPLSFVRGDGAYLYDKKNKAYLDFMSGIAVNSLGHNHPHLVQALKKQADLLWHVSNVYHIEEGTRLAERLCAHSFADRVLFTNSGAEAVETAIKTARRYFYAQGQAERYKLITFEGAFHGRTLATIAAGGQEKYLEGFGPKVQGFLQLPFGDHDALKEALQAPDIAGVLLEPIQGEGGVRPVPKQCLEGLRALCDEHNVLLILDEVQCGTGRTGHLFAHQGTSIEPDIMAIAKGIGGGFPLGACLAKEHIAAAMIAGTHGTTFGGNPLAMAVGNAVLDVLLEDGFLEHVLKMAAHLNQSLGQFLDDHHDIFKSIRGEGLLIGLECKVPHQDIVQAARDQGLLTVGAGDNVLRLLPALIINENHIREACNKLDTACNKYKKTL